jgi:hypothetical protein
VGKVELAWVNNPIAATPVKTTVTPSSDAMDTMMSDATGGGNQQAEGNDLKPEDYDIAEDDDDRWIE